MQPVVQFPDLTEVMGVASNQGGYDYITHSYSIPSFSEKTCLTEFAFGVQAFAQTDAVLVAAGFKPVSTVNNWYRAHYGDIRPQTFWWKKMEGKKNDAPVMRRGFGSITGKKSEEEIIAAEAAFNVYPSYTFIEFIASGCGAALYDNPQPRRPYSIWKFAGLIRIPLEITPEYETWLKKNHYRFLDKGTIAQYWVNGWDPMEWSYEKELERWGGWGKDTCPWTVEGTRYKYSERPASWAAFMLGPDGVDAHKKAAAKERKETLDVARVPILDAYKASLKVTPKEK